MITKEQSLYVCHYLVETPAVLYEGVDGSNLTAGPVNLELIN